MLERRSPHNHDAAEYTSHVRHPASAQSLPRTAHDIRARFQGPRLRMYAQPRFTFRFPSSAQIVRHGVGQAKRKEIHCAFLLPMWKTVRSKTNLRVRIEETQLSHGWPSLSNQEAAPESQKLELGLQRSGFQSTSFRHGGLEPPLLGLKQQLFQFVEPLLKQTQCALNWRRRGHVHACRF